MTSSKLKHINTDYSKLNFELQHNEANIRYTVKSMHEDHTSDVNILSSYSKLLHVLLWSALFRSSFLEIRRQTTMELYIWFLLHIFKYFRGNRVTQDGTTKITKNKWKISDTSMDCRVLWLKDPFNTIPSQIRGVSSIINCIWNFFKNRGHKWQLIKYMFIKGIILILVSHILTEWQVRHIWNDCIDYVWEKLINGGALFLFSATSSVTMEGMLTITPAKW